MAATWGANSTETKTIVEKIFGTYSKTKIDKMRPEDLQEGLDKLRIMKQEKEDAAQKAEEATKEE